MKVKITKTWETTETIEAPDGLTNDELIQYLDGRIANAANLGAPTLLWTGCADKNGDGICVFD